MKTSKAVVPAKKRVRVAFAPVPRPVAPEWKYVDLRITSTTVAGAGLPVLMNGMAQGTSTSTRIGNRIVIKSFEIRAEFRPSGTVSNNIRLMVLSDSQVNGSAPVGTNVFANSTFFTSMRNLNYRKRFKIYIDKPIYISPSGQEGDAAYTHEYYKFRKGLVCEYNGGTAGTVADIATNALFFCIPGYTTCTMDLQYRIRFVDF